MTACDETRQLVEEGLELSGRSREHLRACEDCRAYARQWRLARLGFEALAREAPPEPSLGFAFRLVRRLGETVPLGMLREDFLEFVGRRVVLAGLLLTLVSLVALIAPQSGPVRGPDPAAALAASELSAESRSDVLDDFSSSQGAFRTVSVPQEEGH